MYRKSTYEIISEKYEGFFNEHPEFLGVNIKQKYAAQILFYVMPKNKGYFTIEKRIEILKYIVNNDNMKDTDFGQNLYYEVVKNNEVSRKALGNVMAEADRICFVNGSLEVGRHINDKKERSNILEYLDYLGKPDTIGIIRDGLDSAGLKHTLHYAERMPL